MNGKWRLICLLGYLWLLNTPVYAESYRYAGRDLAANCFQCHGTNGNAVSGMPRLAGMPKEQLISLMVARRSQDPNKRIMTAHAQAYSDAELALIAQYLSEQPQ